MKKLLIIEDDKIISSIYSNKFSQEGYAVRVAFDGDTGFRLLQDFHPDVVILDLLLPGIPGLELLKKIRATAQFKNVPVIVFSNTYQTSLMEEARKAGATKWLSKTNCTPRHVLDAVAASLAPTPVAPEAKSSAAGLTPPSDDEFLLGVRREFVASLPATLLTIRTTLQALAKATTENGRVQQLQDFYQTIRAMTGNAAIAGFTPIAQFGDTFEVLLRELAEKPANINASTTRTVASSVDTLGFLFKEGLRADRQQLTAPRILVVDDEAISRRAVAHALEKAKFKSVVCEDPQKALDMLLHDRFDLIFLDVDMPGMSGFELCAKIRGVPDYKTTPVVFVTSLTDFDSRANSSMSGGNDLIAKPFLFVELAVKALIYVLRARFGPGR